MLVGGSAAALAGLMWLTGVFAEYAGPATLGIAMTLTITRMVLGWPAPCRITERTLHLGGGRTYPWDRLGEVVRIASYRSWSGTFAPGPARCPECGQTDAGGPVVVGLEVRGRHGNLLASINLGYIARPDCASCNPRDSEGYRADSGCLPSSWPFLDADWPRVAELVATLAPHVTITELDLDDYTRRRAGAQPEVQDA